MVSPSSRRRPPGVPRRRFTFRRRLLRRLALTLVTLLVFVLSADPASADVGTFPSVRLSGLSGLVSWLTTGSARSPHFGALPRQRSGTAAGKAHSASAAATRAGKGVGRRPGRGKGELPAYVPPVRRVTKGRSARLAQGYSARTSRRVAAKSSATSDYFQNADGTFTRRLSQQPVNYRAGKDWKPIDTALKTGSDHRWHETANSVTADFAPSAADPNLVRLGVGDGHVVSYGLQGAAAVAPAVSGSTATYAGALPQTDLTLRPTATGMKEALVLRSADAANSWTFPLDLKGLTPVVAKDGSIELVDSAGKAEGVIPRAYAYDSKVDPRSGDPATTHAVDYRLARTEQGGQALVMTLDAGWLHDPRRVFPVTVDPSTDSFNATTTYAESGIAAGDHSTEQAIKIGSYDSGTHKAVSYLQFPNTGIEGSQISVSAASLTLFDTWAATCTAERFDVAPVTQSWSPSQVTTYPGPTYGSSIGNLTPNVPNACANGSANRDVGDEVTVPLSTSTFNSWATGSGKNYGLAVYASTSDSLHWKQFDTAYDTRGGPYLYLTYTNAVLPQVTMQTPPSGYSSGTLTPQLGATATLDPNLSATLKIDFQVYDTAGTKVTDSGLVTASTKAGDRSASYTVPAGKLKWGQTYYWMAQSYDGTNYSPDVGWQTLRTDVPQPTVTSGLSQNETDTGFDPSIGNYTTSDTDADVATAGPDLSVVRDYNSRDPRSSGAFGAGWSTVFDARAVEQYSSSGAVTAVRVTYPDGSEVGYGKNSDGSFSPPQGRFAIFKSVTGGYTLTDKNDMVYAFTQSLGSGAYGIKSITDANGRAETFLWDSGHITTATSAASGRALHLTWQTPSGAGGAHVATVVTDPAKADDASTAQTWTYGYTGDRLTQVCSPVDTTGCTAYGYDDGSQYHNQVLNEGAESFWPLAESSGTTAASAVLANEGTDNATYSGVTLGQPGPLAGGKATAAGFNGSSSSVQLPNIEAANLTSQAVSLWFKTSTAAPGVLLSFSGPDLAAGTTNIYTPMLYVGSDGKLKGEIWYDGTTGGPKPISSSASVADGKWHHVVLSGSWTSQIMWLDGVQLGTGTGAGNTWYSRGLWQTAHTYLGAGFLGGLWPDQPHNTSDTGYATYFNGSIADAAFFTKSLTQADVTDLYSAGTKTASLLSSVTRPSGKSQATVQYDPVTTRVTHVTDQNGGSWTPAAPTVTGSSQVYRAAVLGAGPQDYWRLGDSAGAAQAADEVQGGTASYNNATLGVAGPFTDAKAASFNGSSSYLQLPAGLVPGTGNESVGLWFKTTVKGGVLLGTTKNPISSGTTTGYYTPVLYVGSSGKLHGEFWFSGGTTTQVTTSGSVADGQWHQVILASAASAQSMYLDGQLVGSLSGTVNMAGQTNVYVGTGFNGGKWPDEAHTSTTDNTGYPTYFNGQIAEVSFYRTQLSGQDAAAQWVAGQHSTGLAPMQTVKVTDPGGKTLTYQYDAWNGNRAIARIDGLGNRTTFGYDSGGFIHTVTDPNGDVTTTGHDVRGNEVSKTTCQDQVAQKCSTSYYTYLPDDTTTQPAPSPKNDLMATARDGRSASETDNAYLTSYAYDAAGNRTGVTTPPVAGSPNGRTTAIAYTDGTTGAAADGGYAPAGLPYKTTSPGGAITTVTYFHNGDVASVTDPDGQVTNFTYDGLGRVLTRTVVSDSYPNGLTTSYEYNGVDQPTKETDPPVTNRVTGAVHTAQTTTVYDADGLMKSQTIADLTGGDASRTTSSTYDEHDQRATSTDANNRTTTFGYDGYGNKTSETAPSGTTITYAFDPNGRLTSQTLKDYVGDPVAPSTPRDLVESSRAYDPAGRLASITDSMGNTTAYTYTDNDLTATITRTDKDGKNPFVQQANTYDAAGNLVQQATNNGATVTNSTVDAADRVTATTVDPAGVNRTTTMSYTPDDLVASTTLSDGGGASQTTNETYDPMGHVTSRSVRMDGAGHPVGRWPLDQTSGSTVTDASGTGNTATATGDVTWANQAAVLPGSSTQKIATTGPVVDTTQSFTVSAWVNLSGDATHNQTVVSQDAGTDAGFYLKYNGTSQKWVFTRPFTDTTDPDTANAGSTATATVGAWTHLVGVFDAGTGAMTLYVDGTANKTVTDSTPFSASGPLVIGEGKWDGVPTGFFDGSVSNVQVYPRALSAAEVTSLHDAGRTSGTTAGSASATVTWKLDQRGLPTSMTDPNGNVTNCVYDEAGQQTLTSLPAVSVETGGGAPALQHPVTTVGYDTFGEQTEQQDPSDHVTVTAFDAAGQRVKETLPDYTPPGSSTPITASTSWKYDDDGNVSHVIDPLDHDTHYEYDQLGDVARITDPANGVTHYTYDTNGERLSATDPTGAQTQATYDHLGRQLTATVLDRYPTPTTSTTTSSYAASAIDPGGAFLASTTTQDGVTTSYGYDNVGEATQVTDAAGATTRTAYDLVGRPTTVTRADGTATRTSYDPLDDPVEVDLLDTDGQTVLAKTSATYDAAGRQLSGIDARNNTTTFTRDATGAVTQEVQPVDDTTSITTTFGYDAQGNRTRFTDGRGNSWDYTYNSWNLPESAIEPTTVNYPTAGDRTSTIAYDAAGRPATQTLPGGVSVTTEYDELGRVKDQSGSGADAATAARSFSYDGDGRMLTAETSAVGTNVAATKETFTYNDRGLLLTASGSAGDSSFGYDGDGLPTARTDAAGTTSYTYDTADRLKTLTEPATGTQLTYGYDQLSQLKTITYGGGGNVRTYDYDHLHRLTGDTLKTASGSTVASIAYGYDANGNETSKTTTGFSGSTSNTYTYDKANRLTSWDDGHAKTQYDYDASGNRTRVGANVYTYDARDQLTSDGVNTYSYTARGTLTSQTSANGTVAASSDAYGQQVTQGGETYLNDALGRVVTATSTGGSRAFSYGGTGDLMAADGTNTYTWSPDGSLVGIGTTGGDQSTGVLAYTDAHDDVVGNFTATGTALTGSTTYDPLGNVANTTGHAGSLGYQSGWTDSATGKVDMGSRWYYPAVGQFQNKDTQASDPVPNSAAANPFAYVDDDPLTRTDPTGHSWWGDTWHAVKSVASTTWHAVTSAASWVWNTAKSTYHAVSNYVSRGWNAAVHWVDDAVTRSYRAMKNEIASLIHQLDVIEKRTAAAARRAAAAAAKDAYDKAHGLGRYYRAAAKAVRTTGTFFKNHAAAIASFAASTAVFMGCEAVLGAATGGVGAVAGAMACGAAAGAVGGMIDQGAKCIDGQKGACSAQAFAGSTFLGAVGGAVGGGIGGSLGGKLAESALGDVLPKLVTNVLEGAAIGGVSGGATAAVQYGLTCESSSAGCTWSGLGHAVERGTAVGTVGGAAGGALATGAAAARARFRGGDAEPVESSGGACPVRHSFTASTLVLMADGSSKPIGEIKVGDKVANAVPGDHGESEAHRVEKVIVTKTDHDFIDLTIATHDEHGRPGGVGKLTTTEHHPFYDITQAAFVDAAQLKPGDRLQEPGGHTAEVLDVRRYTAAATTYDLTINGLHTYYVLAGTTPVLVHNIDLAQLNSCPGTKTTHYAQVSVLDAEGNVIHDYDIRSGEQQPAEKAMGPRGAETLSHTENRAARMAGGVPSYGSRIVYDDEFFLEHPVPVDGYVIVQGTRRPCSSCMGAMRRAAQDTSSTFVYLWNESGRWNWWTASG
ncbi:LamG-like jellyroll fold domain-containing protein [Actinoallomurus sp. NPDC052308]|uniref:LamG-like jellyroll fold domain-containing protein n=1 Tax=Actinoallomurus sp. NPDC052308 TaxID=3155530 RepID=UPI00341839E1